MQLDRFRFVSPHHSLFFYSTLGLDRVLIVDYPLHARLYFSLSLSLVITGLLPDIDVVDMAASPLVRSN